MIPLETEFGMRFLSKIELLLVGMWLGAACFFSFGVAPSAFSVLGDAELAGNVVNRTLAIINISGLIIGVLTLLTSFLPHAYSNAVWAWGRRLLLVIFAAACGIGQFVIGFWIAYLRLQIAKPVKELAASDPMKLKFDQLHQASVWVLVAAMAAALLAFFIMTRQEASRKDKKSSGEPDFDFSNEFKI